MICVRKISACGGNSRSMKRFQVTEYELYSDFFSVTARPVTVVLLADLHNCIYGKKNRRLLGAIEKVRPDFVLCAGDMLVGKKGRSMKPAVDFMTAVAKKFPVYYGNGNHEYRMRTEPQKYGSMYQEYEETLTRAGVHFLMNDKAIVPAGNTYVSIYGYELEGAYYRKFNELELTKRQLCARLGEADRNRFSILIAHNPVYGDTYAEWGADLTVSGHLHGGIIRIPGVGGIISPQARLFPKYDGGMYEIGGRHLAVSRGLGGHTVNIRIFNRPELVVIKLCPPFQGSKEERSRRKRHTVRRLLHRRSMPRE